MRKRLKSKLKDITADKPEASLMQAFEALGGEMAEPDGIDALPPKIKAPRRRKAARVTDDKPDGEQKSG
ncbi:hypothetical protein WNY37_08885 [Henriciella sp. AS95]|uniref:hypothetical protein n=1 Tax=Henriciella sp. AS95 TaxID=3135782 RepID=UPI00317B1414